MRPVYLQEEADLRDAGFHILSHFLDSPITGGRSWLADATLLTGIRVTTQHIYNELVGANKKNLTHELKDAGYYSVLAAPGTTKTWQQWKSFYFFDDYLVQGDFSYKGPELNFGSMPDQFLLDYARKEIMTHDTGKPLFLMAILVSSHTPFSVVPAYIPDWNMIGDGSIYYDVKNSYYKNTWLTGGEYPEGYTASVGYVIKVISEFLVKFVHDESLVVIVGDHQPRFPVREKGSSSSVIIHLISRSEDLIAPFRSYGYSSGLRPQQPLPHPGMESFLPVFMQVISGDRSAISDMEYLH
jgi:hypothetical protein